MILEKYCQIVDMRGTSRRPSKGSLDLEPQLLQEAQAENGKSLDEIIGAALDLDQLYDTVFHLERILASSTELLRAMNPIVSMKGATAVILAGLRWKRKALKKSAAEKGQLQQEEQ